MPSDVFHVFVEPSTLARARHRRVQRKPSSPAWDPHKSLLTKKWATCLVEMPMMMMMMVMMMMMMMVIVQTVFECSLDILRVGNFAS